jgi:hypothetical protein
MGSSGTGRLTDYSGRSSKGSSSKTGGSSNEDKCGKAFTASLEEIERCEYFTSKSSTPPLNTEIEIVFKKPRLAAVAGGVIIGYLPTDKNYVKACIDNGYKYPGVVNSSRMKPVPSVSVTVSPHK